MTVNLFYTGDRGRPEVVVTRDQLSFMLKRGLKAVDIANQLGCSASLIYKRLADENLGVYRQYSIIEDVALDEKVKEIHENHRNAGVEVMFVVDQRLVVHHSTAKRVLRMQKTHNVMLYLYKYTLLNNVFDQ